ncbi:MAG: substrate-binding domain-containing protein [Pleurocapsa minor GSE-CHR-MK-17-07R]|jgi:branched-chain amino acid transport system substrate-binding protein|nr:substrate-binding domain-containing protein [Pleurocapsa minor GSE-CHR-MK 17-07R]
MKKKVVLLLAIVLLVFGVGATSAQDEEPLVIGLLVDQSGALTIYGYELEYGFKLGLLYAAGVDLAEYNNDMEVALDAVVIAGRPVEVIVRDNGSNADTAASQARELIEQEGAEILVGAPSSGVMTGVQQVALDSDVILFATPAASPAITGANFNVNTFRVCRNTFQDFLAFAPFATQELGTNFVILAVDNDFGRASAGAASVLASAGISFVSDPIYAPLETTDFTPYLQQVLSSGADAVLPIWAGDGSVTLFQQIAELGVQDQMAVVAAFNSNDIVAVSDPSTIGNISWIVYHYSFPDNEINDALIAGYEAVYNDVPDLFSECSFATAQALVQAVTDAEGDTLPEALIPVLEGMVFEGPKGTYAIRPSDHQALVPMYIAQLANLDDPDQNFYELLATIPANQIIPPVLLAEDVAAERLPLDEAFNAMIAEMGS